MIEIDGDEKALPSQQWREVNRSLVTQKVKGKAGFSEPMMAAFHVSLVCLKKTTRSVKDGIPTPERGNEWEFLPLTRGVIVGRRLNYALERCRRSSAKSLRRAF